MGEPKRLSMRRTARRSAVALGLLIGAATACWAAEPPAEPLAEPPAGLPTGAIVAFLPDPKSPNYADEDGLKRWLLERGWALCDGTDGTPDLNYRLLLGTVHAQETGQTLGSRTHEHRLSGSTEAARGRERAFSIARGPVVRMPGEGHEHRLDAATDKADNLPLSTRVLFIMKVR